MEKLRIEGDMRSPTMDFNPASGEIEISGRSYPEHALNIYQPAIDWLDNYFKNPQDETTVRVKLEYFNTSSSKVVFDIFRKLEEYHTKGKNVKVEWYYENDDFDLHDEGKTFASLVKVPVEMVGIDEFSFNFVQ